jgi:type I restriction enzyme S subunit
LESIPIDRYVTGAAQPKLTQRAMNSIPVPMPKRLDRRKQIVDRIGHLESLTAAAKKICEAKLSALDELKASLLHQAFSGALVGHHESK